MPPAQPQPLPEEESPYARRHSGDVEFGGSIQLPRATNAFEMRADVGAAGGRFAFKGSETIALIALAGVTLITVTVAAIGSGLGSALVVAAVGLLFGLMYLRWGR